MANLASIAREGARGMITLRGDLGSGNIKKAVKSACGQAVPGAGQILGTRDMGVAWMSPDEVLVMVPYADVADTLTKLDKTLAGTHYLAVDVSDARAVFSVIGADAPEVLARLCPVDVHRGRFAVGHFRRSRMAQVPAAFWRHEDGFDVICFRSVAEYMDGLLRNAARAPRTGAFG